MSNQSNQYRNYVPALAGEVLPPPPQPLPETPSVSAQVRAEQAWLILLSANILVTAIIIVAMLIDGTTTRRAIAWGVVYFAPTTTVFVLALTGTLTDIVRSAQREKTERIRIDAYADLGSQTLQWHILVEQNRRLELQRDALPADLERRLVAVETDLLERSLPAPPRQGDTWVSPYDNRKRGAFAAQTQPPHDTTAQEAVAWAMTLYLDNGHPDPARVQLDGKLDARGKIIGPVIGSKRGDGSPEALRWLLQRRVLVKQPGGYALNLNLCPRRDALRYVE